MLGHVAGMITTPAWLEGERRGGEGRGKPKEGEREGRKREDVCIPLGDTLDERKPPYASPRLASSIRTSIHRSHRWVAGWMVT
mmetsp:Transcript_34274/g.84902  ORF Transcript_34274/g.84902 Transcript_34274/m.84902 type:complete len:83 (+) Transcript_34274:878-1126(+)